MTETAKSVIAGTFKPAMVREGLGQMMAVAPFGAGSAGRRARAGYRLGRQGRKGFNPFTGPVTDNTGAVRIPAGESWGGDKMGNFDWYVEGVIGKAK